MAWGHYFQWFSSVPYRIPAVWWRKRFVVVEPWTLLMDLAFFDGWPAIYLMLLHFRVRAPTCTLCGNLERHQYTNRVRLTSGSSAKPTRRLVDTKRRSHLWARFPRCHPVPLTFYPAVDSWGTQQTLLCLLARIRTLGSFPEFLRLRECDAMQFIEWFAANSHHYLLSSGTHLSARGRHRVPFLGSCAVQHKQTLLSVRSKTSILHSFYDSISGVA